MTDILKPSDAPERNYSTKLFNFIWLNLLHLS